MNVTIYGVVLKNDNRILGLAWNEERAHKLVKGVNSLLAPHTTIEDYEIMELVLPPFRNWLVDTIEQRGLDVPEPHLVFHQKKSAHPAVMLLQAYLSTSFDPLQWAMEAMTREDIAESWMDSIGLTVPSRERVEAMIGD